jgi:hypothetical protein
MKITKARAAEDAKRLAVYYGPMAVFPFGPDGYLFAPLEIARRAGVAAYWIVEEKQHEHLAHT